MYQESLNEVSFAILLHESHRSYLSRRRVCVFRRHFHGGICRSKSPVLKIFKNVQKWAFLYGKFWPFEFFFFTFFPPIFLAPLSCSFWTTKLWSGTQNEDFQQKLPSDKKLSFTDQGVHCTVSFTSWWYEFILSYNEHTVKYYEKSDAEEIPVWPQSWSLNQY